MPSRYSEQSFRFLFIVLVFLIGVAGPISSPALAQSYVYGTGSFAVTGYAPGAMVAADFNHDGKVDLAVANQNGTSPGTVSVLLGRPDGSFAPEVDYSLGRVAPTGLAVGDFNGDGIPDLVVSTQSSGIEVLLGKGDGTFQAPITFQVPSVINLTGVAVGDFNHDGKADLAVADISNSDTPQVTIFLGNGDGTFQSGVSYATGGSNSIIAADFNGDGNLDLALGGVPPLGTNAAVSVLLGNGDGTFKPYISTSVPGSGNVVIAAGDLNGDGKLDLVEATASNLQKGINVLMGNGDGTFQTAVTYPETLTGGWTGALAIGDFNGDGKLDVAAANNSDSDVSIFEGNGDGTFQSPVHYGAGIGPEGLVVGDFNSDGHPDLAVSGEGYVTVLLGQGGGAFTAPANYTTAQPPNVVVTGDFNGDGNLDIASAGSGSTGSVSVLLGNGDGTFQKPINTPVGAYPLQMAAGDFNHDGNLDLVVSNNSTVTNADQLSILLGNGDGTFRDAQDIPLTSVAGNIVVADFNNDGNLDIATVQQVTSAVSIFFGKGDGTFAAPVQVPIPTNSSYGTVFTADFNKDGNADLATSISGGAISILLGNGNGTFQPATTVFPGDSLVAVGDFNGDGKPDLVLNYAVDLSVALGNGNGTFQTPSASTYILGQTESPIVGDFNGDGHMDLAFEGSGAVSLLLGNGDGTFGNLINYPPGLGINFATGDFTGNGSLDIAGRSGNGIAVYMATPVAALDPSVLAFASQPLGTASTTQTVTLSNSGSAPLAIAGITAPGGFSETNTCGTGLSPAAKCQVKVSFTPTTAGLRSGELTIDDNAPGSPQYLALSGTGTPPTASASPASLSFSSQVAGVTSTAQAVKLTNTSSGPLSISSISTSGDFAQTNNCGGSLAGGASCTINVTFTPTAAGSRSGTLSIADDAGNSPQTVALTGSGEDFTLGVAAGSSASDSISAGATADYSLSLTPQGGFNHTVALTCTGEPSGSTCTVSPASVTLNGSTAATVKVSATTAAASMLPPLEGPTPFSGGWPEALLGGLGLLALAVWLKARFGVAGLRRLRWTMIAGLLLLVAGMAACGGGGGGGSSTSTSSNPGTAKGTYTLKVTGASGSDSHSVSLMMSVN